MRKSFKPGKKLYMQYAKLTRCQCICEPECGNDCDCKVEHE